MGPQLRKMDGFLVETCCDCLGTVVNCDMYVIGKKTPSFRIQKCTLSPIIMVQWKITLNERKRILEDHFSILFLKWCLLFQGSIFRGELLVSGRVKCFVKKIPFKCLQLVVSLAEECWSHTNLWTFTGWWSLRCIVRFTSRLVKISNFGVGDGSRKLTAG